MLVSVESLLVIVLVLTPGYVFSLALRKTVINLDTSAIRFVVMTVATGALIHCITFFWSARLLRKYVENPASLLDTAGEVFLWGITTIFILPLALGLGLGYLIRLQSVDRWLGWVGFSHINRIPSAWDYVLDLNEGFYVRVHLKDGGGILGGVYGTNSFAADENDSVDLYLQELWLLDDNGEFLTPVPTSRGVWIARDSAEYIEFLSGEDDGYGTTPDPSPSVEAKASGSRT